VIQKVGVGDYPQTFPAPLRPVQSCAAIRFTSSNDRQGPFRRFREPNTSEIRPVAGAALTSILPPGNLSTVILSPGGFRRSYVSKQAFLTQMHADARW
jgi:hypothetical protein